MCGVHGRGVVSRAAIECVARAGSHGVACRVTLPRCVLKLEEVIREFSPPREQGISFSRLRSRVFEKVMNQLQTGTGL